MSYNILLENGFALFAENGDNLVLESYVPCGQGRPGKKREEPDTIEKDNSELWEIGASIYRINDNSYEEPITIKKYITEENDIKIIIGENIYFKSPDIIMENVTAKLVSNRIRE